MFQSTQPNDSALMRISDYERQHGAARTQGEAGSTRLASLNPSLLQDLLRFEPGQAPGSGLDTLELLGVMAAALRHDRALLIHLQLDYRVIPVTVRPAERQLLSPLPLAQLLELRLPDLRVLRVEPAAATPSPGLHASRLSPLLWELALRGSREALLPEIAGVAAYRLAPTSRRSTWLGHSAPPSHVYANRRRRCATSPPGPASTVGGLRGCSMACTCSPP
ncbi:MAG TPA: hypothetical protein VK439_02745 [Rubrivivax sp.]|nr:hypothetical protein [Rubrivivax sp.]